MSALVVVAACSSSAADSKRDAADAKHVAARSTPMCAGDWCWVSPQPQGNRIAAVWAASATEAWAVGNNGTILHLRGGTWRNSVAPLPGHLEAVWGTAADNVWIAGAGVAHWDGHAWSAVPDVPTTWRSRAIAGTGPDDVWIATANGSTWHYDGGMWSEHVVRAKEHLVALWAGARNDAWTVSMHGDVFHWDGSAWTLHTARVASVASAVAGAGSRDLWVAGSELVHWDGTAWTAVPKPPRLGTVTGLWGTRSDAMMAADPEGLIRWDGKMWSRIAGVDNPRVGFAGLASGAWIATASGAIVRWTQSATPSLRADRPFDGGPIWGANARDIWIAGHDRTYAHWDGKRWTTVAGPEIKPHGLWGSGPSDVWAVGAFRGAAHWNGNAWSRVALPDEALTYHAIAGTAADDVWAVGDRGVAIHWDGSAWQRHESGVTDAIYGVWAHSRTDAWAVGDGGSIVRWNGTRWSAVTSPTSERLTAVWGSGATDVWAIAARGIFHWDGSAWREAAGGAKGYFMRSVFGTGPNDVWIAGLELLHWDGRQWTTSESPAGMATDHLWSAGDGVLWASGISGVLVRK